MSKNDFISSSVLEFKVPLDLGYAYCKVVDFKHIREFDGVLVKVFDLIVQEPIKDINILRERDWLFGARRLYKLPNTKGKGAWKVKGVLIAEDDNIIPDFKYAPKASPLVEDESSIKEWYVNRNLVDVSYEKTCTHDQVNHLEDTVLSSQYGIEVRTAMEYIRINGKDVAAYFDLKDIRNKNIYRQMINVPVYKTVPKEIRGKALCTDNQKAAQ